MKYIKVLFLAVSLAFIAPQMADAAWWNPLSWFKEESVQVPADTTFRAQVAPMNAQLNSEAEVKSVMPVQTQQIQRFAAPATNATSSARPAVAPKVLPTAPVSVIESQVEVPIYALDPAFTSAQFIAPREVKNGQVVMSLKPGSDNGGSAWQIDRMGYHIVSDRLRSGDVIFSVAVGGLPVKDVSTVNDKTSISLVGRPANTDITFLVNGSLPSKGDFKVVIDELTGYRTSDSAKKSYIFIGSPIEGPRFDI